MANLILWRHAEAEMQSITGEDADRALTKRGRKDAAKMAAWLAEHLPENTEILCSPARRCLETLATLQQLNMSKAKRRDVKVAAYLGVDGSVSAIAKQVCNDDVDRTILIVGHQPNLGLLIARLIGMQAGACSLKKGAVWWIRQRHLLSGSAPQTYLFAVQQPNY